MYLLITIGISVATVFRLPDETPAPIKTPELAIERETAEEPIQNDENEACEEDLTTIYETEPLVDNIPAVNSNATMALVGLSFFVVLTSIYSGYIELIWTTAEVIRLNTIHPNNFLAFPQYVLAFGCTDTFCELLFYSNVHIFNNTSNSEVATFSPTFQLKFHRQWKIVL